MGKVCVWRNCTSLASEGMSDMASESKNAQRNTVTSSIVFSFFSNLRQLREVPDVQKRGLASLSFHVSPSRCYHPLFSSGCLLLFPGLQSLEESMNLQRSSNDERLKVPALPLSRAIRTGTNFNSTCHKVQKVFRW